MSVAQHVTVALRGRWSGTSGTARCPAHEDRSPSLSLADGANGQLLLKCHAGCAYGDVSEALRRMGLTRSGGFRSVHDLAQDARRAVQARKQLEKRSRQARAIWDQAQPVHGTLGETYLRNRGIKGPLPSTLRYVGDCWHSSARRAPALVAYVSGVAGCAVHRTYLSPDGNGKADLAPNKAMLGSTKGGAVQLSSGSGPLVLTEGIETGLSLLSGLLEQPVRVWAALSAGGLRDLRLPETNGNLVIAADGDAVGLKAANTLADRAYSLGWSVSILPAPTGSDWNDVLLERSCRT